MRFSAYVWLALALLPACNPTFNWRDVRPDGSQLALLMPCKPDKAQKTVPIAGQPTELMLLSCDAGGVTFAVAMADVKEASVAAAALTQWQSATLATMKATSPTVSAAFKLPGSSSGGVLVKAAGQRANGRIVSSHALYWAKGSQVFQAMLYADKIESDVADTFFTSLKFE